MAKIDRTNLFSEARNNIVALLDSRTNVADPVCSSSEHRKFLYSREPDIKDNDFDKFPFIIVHPVIPELPMGGSGDGKHKFVNFDIQLEVVTSDREFGNLEGKGLVHLEAICNDIAETMMSMTNRTILCSYGMENINIIPGNTITEEMNNKLVYRTSMIINCTTRMRVSA